MSDRGWQTCPHCGKRLNGSNQMDGHMRATHPIIRAEAEQQRRQETLQRILDRRAAYLGLKAEIAALPDGFPNIRAAAVIALEREEGGWSYKTRNHGTTVMQEVEAEVAYYQKWFDEGQAALDALQQLQEKVGVNLGR